MQEATTRSRRLTWVLAGCTLAVLDAVSPWLILGVAHPGAALVVGPVLITLPYSFARAISNRLARPRPSRR
jgi:hypothetical protein